jgi:adenine C2-methylase RlmN of 23S rRNA A2503 and tRNA A37
VCENLSRYSEHGFVEPKYVILPGINDNDDDMNGFVDLCVRVEAKSVAIAKDMCEIYILNENTVSFVARLVRKLQQSGMSVSAPDWMFYGEKNYERISEELTRLKDI